jgi:sulfatase maturation enzyme AslB (radical SAM superfamily)
MKRELFEQSLDFLDSFSSDQVRFLGGEPTLHPEFKELMTAAGRTGKKLVVFTNGFFGERTRELLLGYPSDVLTVLVNVTAAGCEKKSRKEIQEKNLSLLGQRAALGFNLHRPGLSIVRPLELLEKYGLHRVIRLSLAHPCLNHRIESIRPYQYPAIGSEIAGWAAQAASRKVVLSFDCGFVPCMFSEGEMEKLAEVQTETRWHCGPILDISPAGDVLHCLPLARAFSVKLSAGLSADEVREELTVRSRPFRQAGIYKDCSICELKRNGVCPGGCLAATMLRFYPSFSKTLHLPGSAGKRGAVRARRTK